MADDKIILDFDSNLAGIDDAIAKLRVLGNLSIEQEKQLTDLANKSVDATKKQGLEYQKTGTQLGKLNQSLKQTTEALAGGAISDATKKFQDIGKGIGDATVKSERLTTTLRRLKNEIAQTEFGSEKFRKLSIEAARVEDKIGDVNRQIRTMASDTFAIDAVIDGVRGITAAFTIAQSASALFGDENKDLQKALLKVQAATGLLIGVQEIANQLTGQGAAKVAILSGVQKAYTFVVEGATVATRVFNAAILGIVGGAILAGLAAIVIYWKDISKFIGLSSDAAEDFNKLQLSILDKRIKLAEIAGKQTFDLREKQLREELRQLKTSAERQLEILDALDVLKAERSKAFADEQRNIDKENLQRKIELAQDGSLEELNLRKQLIDKEAFIEIAAAQNNEDAIYDILRIADDKKLKLEIERLQKIEGERLKNIKRSIDEESKLRTTKTEIEQVKAGTEAGNDELKRITSERVAIEQDTANKIISIANELFLAKKEAANNIRKIEQDNPADGAKKIKEIQNELLAFQKQKAAETVLLEEQKVQAINENTLKLYQFNASQRDADLNGEKKHQKAVQQAIIDSISGRKHLTVDEQERLITARKELYDIEISFLEIEKNTLKEDVENGVKTKEDAARRIKEIDDEIIANRIDGYREAAKQDEEIREQGIQASLQLAQELSNTLFEISSQRRDAELEFELQKLEDEKDFKLSNKRLTEDQKFAIETEYRKKESQLKREAFKKDRDAKIIQASINTALAVVNAIATAPNIIAGLILAGVAAGLGAAQIAIIASQPTPAFKHGTKNSPEGWAKVGEEGEELVYLPRGSKVISHPDSKKLFAGDMNIMKKYQLPALPEIMKFSKLETSKVERFDYRRLGEELGKNLSKFPQTNINIDESGFHVNIQKGLKNQILLNKTFSSK